MNGRKKASAADGATGADDDIMRLRLFVAGQTPNSVKAIANLRKICEEYLPGRYDLEVIDLHQQPHLAQQEQIVAVPTLMRKLPLPFRRIIGDLSNTERVLVGLNIRSSREPERRDP